MTGDDPLAAAADAAAMTSPALCPFQIKLGKVNLPMLQALRKAGARDLPPPMSTQSSDAGRQAIAHGGRVV